MQPANSNQVMLTRCTAVASIFGKGGSTHGGASLDGSEGSGANTPPSIDGEGARGLVFPPLNIAQTGIDIDMDNLFRRCVCKSALAGWRVQGLENKLTDHAVWFAFAVVLAVAIVPTEGCEAASAHITAASSCLQCMLSRSETISHLSTAVRDEMCRNICAAAFKAPMAAAPPTRELPSRLGTRPCPRSDREH